MAFAHVLSSFLDRTTSTRRPRSTRGKRASGTSSSRAITESLENRQLFATASAVENVLLPQFITQVGNPNNQLPASDAWWALRSQRDMAVGEPVSKVMNLGAHNGFNALNEGFQITRFFAPNQILSLEGQLDLGARLVEFDVHDPVGLPFSLDRNLLLKHGPGPYFLTRGAPFDLDDALATVQGWLARPENKNEVVYLDIEDGTEQAENGADDPLLPKLQSHLGSMIYTPAERAADGRWPSRSELVARGERVIIFTHRNDDQNGRFGAPQMHTDPNGHVWYGASLAFRANGGEDPVAERGNFRQARVDQLGAVPSEDANLFFATQSDGLAGGAPRHDASDVARDARLNVDFIKMDFLFGDDEDADLGNNVLPTNDPFFDIPEDNRVELLEKAVWSWAKHDPAVDRQIFSDLAPGDGTGGALFNFVANRAGLAAAQNLANVGAAARANGLDVAVQNTAGRWESAAPTSSTPLRFAARSITANAAGEFDWALTTGGSTNWSDGPAMVRQEFGPGFIFAGPVNGFQNAALDAGDATEPVWMNVQDLDRDGNWEVNANRPPTITSVAVQPTATDEGTAVELTVDFTDDPDGHTVEIDWGNGAPISVVQVTTTQQQRVVVPYVYKDDHPASGTASDNFNIKVTLTDAGGLSDEATTQVTVQNVAPVIATFASDATLADLADEGEPVNILASFTDAGVLDTHTAVVDWGDGSAPQAVTVNPGTAGAGTVTGTHAYAAGGIYTITLTLTDDDTGAHTATATAVVKGVGLSNGTLYVIGSPGDDHVHFNQTGNGRLNARATFIPEGTRVFDVTAVEKIVVYLGDGDDDMTISTQVLTPILAHGGAGSDGLNAGGGRTVLLGDAGDDRLMGGGGRGILIGGDGVDALLAGRGGDVLIGGPTNADGDDDALLTALNAWNAPTAYPARAAAVGALLADAEDGDADDLHGGSALDLFYNGTGDILKFKRDEIVLS